LSFTVGKKLFLGVGTLVVLIVCLGVTAIVSMSHIGDLLHEIVGKTAKKQLLAAKIQTQVATLLSMDRGVLMRGYQGDQAGIHRDSDQFIAAAKEMRETTGTLAALLSNPKAKEAVAVIQQELPRMEEDNLKLTQAALAKDMTAGMSLYNDALKPSAKLQNDAATEVIKIQEKRFTDDSESAEGAITSNRWTIGLLFCLAAVVSVVVVFVVKSLNATLRNSVIEMAEASVQIAAAAGQVSSSSQAQAQGASEQVAMIEETSAATTEISSMAQRAAESSRRTAEIVSRSQEGFKQTDASLTALEGAMEGIDESSKKISQIIKVIDGIAFQTNILALNAAVEAARAGEAGMGFAVVAEEVRSLAQRSAQAAKDTGSLIEESIDRSKQGRAKVDEVIGAIRSITSETLSMKQMVDEINQGSSEQSRGIDQIGKAIVQMEHVTQTNAAGAEEGAAAAEELNAQAEKMKDVVESLRVMVDGASTNSGANTLSARRFYEGMFGARGRTSSGL
jgi:methyl-accepting chemotaxis protein/methyl-accepting chemotaxis protein-1 (serine sensor receptor)